MLKFNVASLLDGDPMFLGFCVKLFLSVLFISVFSMRMRVVVHVRASGIRVFLMMMFHWLVCFVVVCLIMFYGDRIYDYFIYR